MNRDKQTKIHELAKQMSEAISTAVEQRYIEDEAKLEAVLKENGWCKASEVASEIFEEIEKITMHNVTSSHGIWLMSMGEVAFAELKKKYTEREKD